MGSYCCRASTSIGVVLVGIDAMAEPHMATGREEVKEADRRGLGFSGRGGEGGSERGRAKLGHGAAGLAHAGGREGGGDGLGCCGGLRGGRE